jgi:hypothetical protein
MEEAVGDCTNLHIAYPALVYGFLHVLRATASGPLPNDARHFLKPDDAGNVQTPDIALLPNGEVAGSIQRYHAALSGLAGRAGVRNDLTRYEAVALVLASPGMATGAGIVQHYPPPQSPLLISQFFSRLYMQYDERFVYGAPALARMTQRLAWDPDSPAFEDPRIGDLEPRVAAGPIEPAVPEDEMPDPESNDASAG